MTRLFNDPERFQSLDDVAEHFLQQLRQHDAPSIREYQEAFPDWAAEIEELFPTLAGLEQLDAARNRQSGPGIDESLPQNIGPYSIRREIGRGGMGVVYEAVHSTMCRRVALKLLPLQGQQVQQKKRFIREARAAGQLHHTNIVPVFEVGESDGYCYYAMQYIDGHNLDTIIDDLRLLKASASKPGIHGRTTFRRSGIFNTRNDFDATDVFSPENSPSAFPRVESESPTLPVSVSNTSTQFSKIGQRSDDYFRRVARVGVQIADAIQYAHSHGVLHRDIKPSNLILDADGTVWVTDFGLAKDGNDNLTHTGDIVGTIRYMAPERFHRDADVASEIYGIGLTLYELCTLRHAYDESDRPRLIQQILNKDPVSPRRIRPEIPIDLETVIIKAIARESAKRYQTAHQLAADLNRFISDRPVLARRVSMSERLVRWVRRNPARSALVGCLLLIGLIVVGGSLYLAKVNREHAQEMLRENTHVLAAKEKAEEALESAERANLASRAHLYYTHLEKAQALLSSGRAGQRFESLKAIKAATSVVPQLDLTPDKAERRYVALRSTAMAAMARWDVEVEHEWRVETEEISTIAYDFENRRYAVADEAGNLKVVGFDNQEQTALLPTPGQQAWYAVFSNNGRFLMARYHDALTQENPIAVLWDVDQHAEVARVPDITLSANHVFSADDSLAAVALSNKHILVIETATGQIRHDIERHVPTDGLSFAKSDTMLLVVDHQNESVEFLVLDRPYQSARSVVMDSPITAMTWNDSHHQLAIACQQEIFVFDLNSASPPEPKIFKGHTARVVTLWLHPGGQLLFSSAWDGTTRLFDLNALDETLRIEGRSLAFNGFDRTGRQIGYRGQSGEFGVWRLPAQRACTTLVSTAAKNPRGQGLFVPDHPNMVCQIGADTIQFVDHSRGISVGTIPFESADRIRFGARSHMLYACNRSGIRRWPLTITSSDPTLGERVEAGDPEVLWSEPARDFDVDELSERLVLEFQGAMILRLDLLSGDHVTIGSHERLSNLNLIDDGKHVVTTTWQGSGVKVWNVETQCEVADLAPDARTASMGLDPDGPLFILTKDRLLRFVTGSWELAHETPRPVRDGWAGAIAISPNASMMAMTSSRYVPQLVCIDSDHPFVTMEGATRFMHSSMFWSDDGRYLSVSSPDHIQVWNIQAVADDLHQMQIPWPE